MFSYIVLDIETSKKPRMHPWMDGAYISSVGIKTSAGKKKVWYFNPLVGDYDASVEDIQWYLDHTNVVVGHHLLFDMTWLYHLGLHIGPVECTMTKEYLKRGQIFKDNHGYMSLNNLCRYYQVPTKLDAMQWYWDNEYDTHEVPLHVHEEYLFQDLDSTEAVYLAQKDKVFDFGLDNISNLTHIKTRFLAKAIARGAPFDMDRAWKIYNEATALVDDYEESVRKILKLPHLSLKSPKQLTAALYGGTIKMDGVETYTITLKDGTTKERSHKIKKDVVLPGVGWESPIQTKTGGDSASANSLGMLKAKTPIQKQLLPLLQARADLTGRLSTLYGKEGDKGWIPSVGIDGRIHGRFSQTFTSTGRLVCQQPNLLNIPRGKTSPLKEIFNPGPGKLIINADLSQIEWRVAAQLCQDKTMVEELRDRTDIHKHNAIHILESKLDPDSDEFKKGPRQDAKVVAFRIIYGGGASGFHFDPKMPDFSLSKWKKIVEGFLAKYPGLPIWWQKVTKSMSTDGYYRLPSGRVIPSPDHDMADDRDVAGWIRKHKNYPVQSCAADVLLVVIKEYLRRHPEYFTTDDADVLIFLFVYDSLVFEVSYDKCEKVVGILLDIFDNLTTLVQENFGVDILIPLEGEVEVGKDYATTTKVNRNNYKEMIRELTNDR